MHPTGVPMSTTTTTSSATKTTRKKRAASAARAAADAVVKLTAAAASAADDEEDAGSTVFRGSPLFDDVDGNDFDHIAVRREGPVEEGMLGRLPTTATEDLIFARFGGGKFKVFARTSKAKILGTTTIDIAGEPKFKSAAARKQYAEMVGIDEQPSGGGKGPAPGPFDQMLAWMQLQTSKSAEDHTRRMAEVDAAHRRDLERLKAEAEARSKEEERRAERERRLDEERADRLRRENEEARRRDREFQATMLEASKKTPSGPDPMTTFTTAVKLVSELKGSDEDPLDFLVKNMPTFFGRNGEAKGGGDGGQAVSKDPNAVVFEGDLAVKARAAIEHLQAQGVDVEATLIRAFTALLAFRRPAPAPPPEPVAAAAGAGAPPAAPAPAPETPPAAPPSSGRSRGAKVTPLRPGK